MDTLHTGGIVQVRAPQEALTHILTGAPSWLGSAVFHAMILLIFAQIGWEVGAKSERIALVEIEKPREEEVTKDEEDKPDKPELDELIVDSTLPPSDTAAAFDQELPQLDINVSGFNPEEPDDAPPLAIAKLALGEDGAPGHFHGLYGKRGGWGTRKRKPGGGPDKAEESAIKGFGWLARVQEADGHWDSRKWGGQGQDVGVTGLATLAFLGAGETDRDGKYRKNVAMALDWLEKHCTTNGSFGEAFYTQGICTMAMAEAYGMTNNPRWGAVAQKALDYCVQNQNPNGGWDYQGNNPNRVDTSVTGWMVMAVKAGVASNLRVPDSAIERIKTWLRESINADGSTGYTKNIGGQGSSGGISVPGLTAAAALCRQFMGWERNSPDLAKAINYVDKAGVNLGNLYQVYYGTLAMFQSGDEGWMKWRKQMHDPLIALQIRGKGQDLNGSWEPAGDALGTQGGRVYTTAMAIFSLEAESRYLRVLK